ncbi:MAG: type 1 glutamine amidotransferase [Blastocatellia bacterium]|nr:type 1 glutamine amidotransferase [Blastocatellia bacterium]
MRLHSLQHVPFEDLAAISAWTARQHHSVSVTHLFHHEPLPQVTDFDLLVVLGGPMNVSDEAEFPWLREEKRFIEEAIQAEKKILGICLGSQLLADVLGARVFRNEHKEIGWFPVELTQAAQTAPLFADFPPVFTPFHWHGDTFDLPSGATHIGQSPACRHQAFTYGNNVVGLQFHLESTPVAVARMIDHERDDMTPGPYVQSETEILNAAEHFAQSQNLLFSLLDRFC